MKNFKLFTLGIPFLVLVFSGISCTASVFPDIQRERREPGIIQPTLSLFEKINIITVRWESDELADEYLLQKKKLGIGDYEEAYRGTSTQYVSMNIGNNEWYYYRLLLRRGTNWFTPSQPVVGVGSSTVKDDYEPNDTIEDSVNINTGSLDANLFRYKNATITPGITIEDNDWYNIEILGKYKANIVIKISYSGANIDSIFAYQIQGGNNQSVTNNNAIPIENNNPETKRIHFRVFPATDFPEGRFISYNLEFTNLQKTR